MTSTLAGLEDTVAVVEGILCGTCEKCSQPKTGSFDCDDEEFTLKCVNCGWLETYAVDRFDLTLRRLPTTRRRK